jgi:hypothetical protein
MMTTYLATLNSHIGKAQSRTPSKLNASVSVTIARESHCNLNVLELGSLSHTPIQSRERIACPRLSIQQNKQSLRLNTHLLEYS